MYVDNRPIVENVSNGDVIKKEISFDNPKFRPNHGWPEWLPQDWCIHQNVQDIGVSSNVYYSNPIGERFYSKEEVCEHIATHSSHTSHVKVFKTKRKSKRKKLIEEDNSPLLINSSPKWPEWLPQDWCIKRTYDDPSNVYYYSPEWKKFRCKDEVLEYITAQFLKSENEFKLEPGPKYELEPEAKPRQIRRKRKISKANKNDESIGTKRRRKGKNNVTN